MFICFLYCLKEYAYPWIYQKSKENSSGWNHILCSKALGLPSIYRSFTKLLLFCKASEYRMKSPKVSCFLLKFYVLESIYIRGSYFKCFGAKACRRYFETFFLKDEQLYIRYLFIFFFLIYNFHFRSHSKLVKKHRRSLYWMKLPHLGPPSFTRFIFFFKI